LGLAYSPQSSHGLWGWLFGGPGKTSFRAGAGMYYDLFGQGIARLYDSTALGFSTLLQNPATVAITSAPRYTGFYDRLPGRPRRAPRRISAGPAGYLPNRHGLDNKLKSPYSINLNSASLASLSTASGAGRICGRPRVTPGQRRRGHPH
jgi:hypothetical protein